LRRARGLAHRCKDVGLADESGSRLTRKQLETLELGAGRQAQAVADLELALDLQCLADWTGYGRPQARPVPWRPRSSGSSRTYAPLWPGTGDRAAVLRQVKRPCAGGVVGGPF